jgi:hypothetical protein
MATVEVVGVGGVKVVGVGSVDVCIVYLIINH